VAPVSGPWNLAEGPGGTLRTYVTPHPVSDPMRSAVVICHDFPIGRGGAPDHGRSYLMLADRVAVESGRRVVTGTLRGAGGSEGDFSIEGWLEDLAFLVDLAKGIGGAGVWLIGFGIGGALCLRHAASDEAIHGVASLGAPADLAGAASDPEGLLERVRSVGVIGRSDFPSDVAGWARQLADLRPLQAAADLRPRPLLVVHGADDQDVPTAAARALAESAAPHSDLRLVFGAGHWLRADPRVVATLMGWLERRH
jgi:uncharacterized protein